MPADCRIEACELHVNTRNGPSSVPLEFDSSAPLLPDPELTVTPATGLVDGQVVDVNMSGPWGFVTVQQCLTSGPCLDPIDEFGQVRTSDSILVHSSEGGVDCGASHCVLRGNVSHPRLLRIKSPIGLAPGPQSATDPTSTFDGPVPPPGSGPSTAGRPAAPLAPRFTG